MYRVGLVAASPRQLAALLRQVDAGRLCLELRQQNLILDMLAVAVDAQRETQIPHKFARMAEPRPMRHDGDDNNG